MPKIEIPELSFPTQIDSTMLATFDSCPQKFFIEYFLHLAPTGRSPDLHAGGAFATALEHTRRALYMHDLPLADAILPGLRAFMQYWGDYEPPEDHPKSRTNTFNAVLDYFAEYPPAQDPVQPYINEAGEPAVEFTFAEPTEILHPETQQPILHVGRFDMLGVYNKSLLAVVDEKTTKALGAMWAKQWMMRGQFIGYCRAAQRAGFDCSTAIIRGIAIQKTQYKHMQVIESFPRWQIERWWDETQRKIAQMIDYWHMTKYIIEHNGLDYEKIHRMWPYSYGDACSSYGGCSFAHLCTVERPSEWYDNYSLRFWDPLKKDPTADSPDDKPKIVGEYTWEELMS